LPGSSSGWREPRQVLIVASSGRALAASTHRAGFATVVLDLFDDTDLRSVAKASARVARRFGRGFDQGLLLEAAARLAPASDPPTWGFVYGGGLEARPRLIDRLAAGRRLFGNTAKAVRAAKDPVRLSALLDRLGIPHPETSLAPPETADKRAWLVKQVGGAGGVHIRFAADAARRPRGRRYYQRFVEGRPASVLVLGTARGPIVLGLSEQWPCPGSARAPFRYGGATVPAVLPEGLGDGLSRAACALVEALALVGLNSVDFLVDEEAGAFHLIEVNPRPGATCELFERALGRNLFDLHLRACAGERIEAPAAVAPPSTAFAGAILYSDEDLVFPAGFPWPDWTADRPAPGTKIAAGHPVCTVFGEAQWAAHGAAFGPRSATAAARELALARAEALRGDIRRCIQSDARVKRGKGRGNNRHRADPTGAPQDPAR
jgi:predicted ATP-grasp superfamily ATP-dependent carboligase